MKYSALSYASFLPSQVKELEESIAAAKRKRRESERALETHEAELQTLQASLTSLEQSKQALEADLSAQTARAESAESALAVRDAEMGGVNTLRSDLAAANERVRQLEEGIHTKGKELETVGAQLTEITEKHRVAQEKALRARVLWEKGNKEVERLKAEVARLEEGGEQRERGGESVQGEVSYDFLLGHQATREPRVSNPGNSLRSNGVEVC